MITYKAKYGDTLYSISRHFGVCPGVLAMTNNIICQNQLFEGKDLIIPSAISSRELNSKDQSLNNNLQTIKSIFSQEGSTTGGVYKFTFPRLDLKVRLDGITLEPSFALTSWVAFDNLDNHSMLMGDLVLLESEVGPVMSSLLSNGIQITALHNHLLNESPRVMYMHIKGEGDPIKLAKNIKDALALTTTPLNTKQQQPTSQSDWKVIEAILGLKGSHKGNVLQLSIPRTKTISEDGQKLPPAMGISHAINFQSIGQKVAATGDFVLLANEVNPVARILRNSNIAVTAIHNHMLTEIPRLFFMHFWAVGNPEDLAHAFKSVLELAK